MNKIFKKLLTLIRKDETLKQASKQASKQTIVLLHKKGGMLTKYTSFNNFRKEVNC